MHCVFCGSACKYSGSAFDAGLLVDKLIPWSDHPHCSCAVRDLCAHIIDSLRSPLQIFAARELVSSAYLQHELVLWGLRTLTCWFQQKMVWIRFFFWHKICPGQTNTHHQRCLEKIWKKARKECRQTVQVWSSDWWLVEALHFVILLQSWVLQVCM